MPELDPIEADARFPSGNWVGFFTDKRIPGKHSMELLLTFRAGAMTGEGRDRVGEFSVGGTYHLDNGCANFRKTYRGKHTVNYSGFNEGKGIWGTWELEGAKGGFHIWPEGMGDPTQDVLEEEAPIAFEEPGVTSDERELVPMGA